MSDYKSQFDKIFDAGLATVRMFEKTGRLEGAIALALRVHAGQKDKAGKPYITHPLRVMLDLSAQGQPEDVLIAAVLHDTVEDTDLTLERIEATFGWGVAATVDAVSRRSGETYKQFIERAKRHPQGRLVKIADVKDNMRPERFVPGLEGLMKRYEMSLEILSPTGIKVGDRVKVVRVLEDSERVLGKTGTVKHIDPTFAESIGVQFDEKIRYGHTLEDESAPDGTGWYVMEGALRKL